MLNCFKDYKKIYSHFDSYLAFGLTHADETRTTRMSAFWEYPLPPPSPHDYPYYWLKSGPMSKQDKVKVTHLKILPKIQILVFCKNLYRGHTFGSSLIRWMCKYEMDLASIVEATAQTWFCPQINGQMDRRTDGWTDGQTDGRETSIPPFQLPWSGGYN